MVHLSLLFSLPQSPLLAEAYYRLGTIQYNILQDFERAQILLKTALKNNPPNIMKLKIIYLLKDYNQHTENQKRLDLE